MNLWKFNENINCKTNITEPIIKIASINNNLFILTINNNLYQGLVEENSISLSIIDKFKPLNIETYKDSIYLINTEGHMLICNEQLEILNSISLIEEFKCPEGHEAVISQKLKIIKFAINDFGCLFLSETNQLWGSSKPNETPKKIEFLLDKYVYDFAIGLDYALVLVGKQTNELLLIENSICKICNNEQSIDVCPLGIKLLNNEDSIEEEIVATTKNIIFRNTEAAKEFLTKQISKMSSIESKIIKENMSNVATFVYEGVKSLSRHVSSSSECTENNNLKKNSKEDLSISQSSTFDGDLSEVGNLDGILKKGADLLNREVWMWGDVKCGSSGAEKPTDSPTIISSLSNLGITKVSLQGTQCCALTLDGRAFIWAQNSLPKQFQTESNERISDASCGLNFTVILSNKSMYFDQEASSYQIQNTINNSLLVDKELVLLNVGAKFDVDFCIKEQIILEEMLLVQHTLLTDDYLCKCYIDLLNFLAANLESLIMPMNDILIVNNIKEFIIVYKNYVKAIQDVLCINGCEHISKLLNPLKNTSHYMDFYKKYSTKEHQTKWQEFIDFIETKSKDTEKTLSFWQTNSKSIDCLKTPNRRFILDSQIDPINMQNSSIFSSHRFILFSDIFAHITGSSNHYLHPLTTIWIYLDQENICLKMPEDFLTLTTPDASSKNKWFHCLQNAIKVALNKLDLIQPPLVRSGSYTFVKSGFFKDGTYSGRWLSGKMHGTGKFRWPDGRVYSGQFEHGFLNGFGIMDTPNVGIYEGECKNNKPHGHGTYSYHNGDIYKGYFIEGLFHGHGLLRKGNFMANSASLYIGEWNLGKKSGYGVMDDISTGEKYLGNWANCKKEGNGSIVTSEGTYYEGNFHNDALLGHGIMVSEDGTHYEGEFKGTGLIGGKGILTLPTGHTIEGLLTGSMDQGIKITQGIFQKKYSHQKSFRQAPAQKWQALFRHCQGILGDSEDTSQIWQNVAVHLARSKQSLNNLDVILPFGEDKLNGKSYKDIKTYLSRAFESNFHPLGNLLNNLCEAYISSYSGKIHLILVNHAILEITDLTQRVYKIVRLLFPALPSEQCIISSEDNNASRTSEIIINYQSLLYPIILPKIYNCLYTLLSLKHEIEDIKYKNNLIEWNKLPDKNLMSLLGVEKKFQNSIFNEPIETLQQIITIFLPNEKLLIIRKTIEKMTPIAKKLLGTNYVWNMDDLFPLFLYVVVRARIPHLGAELEFMEHFMDKSMENGELGIMFTTLKACYQQILQDKSHYSDAQLL
ncbi:unnamed protein product [Ceutorhynchus assimilis]|uniref:VPS9 domain-containing protein n=1 Tax=Ceutorhynchus assimilis TaxID=467358 RepID=A0A9N9QR60_9CUCU|nr:unnamed protein product [Ceutorhynchus assimilis]